MATTAKQSGFLVQSDFGVKGNFEVVISEISSGDPQFFATPPLDIVAAGSGFFHYWRDNDGHRKWSPADRFGTGEVRSPSLIQSNYGNLEVVAREENKLVHYWRDVNGNWNLGATFGESYGVIGNPAFIQSSRQNRKKGDFEVVVPLPYFPRTLQAAHGGGFVHFLRDNDDGSNAWSEGIEVGSTGSTSTEFFGPIDSLCLIQGSLGNPDGNLDVVARQGDQLTHFWSDGDWHRGVTFGEHATGEPSLIQSAPDGPGTVGNFQLVVPNVSGGVDHYVRYNNVPDTPWERASTFGSGGFWEVSLIQSNYGGNLEVVGRLRDSQPRSVHFYRDAGTWNQTAEF